MAVQVVQLGPRALLLPPLLCDPTRPVARTEPPLTPLAELIAALGRADGVGSGNSERLVGEGVRGCSPVLPGMDQFWPA